MKVVEEIPNTSSEEENVDVKYLNGQEIRITKDYSGKYAYLLIDSKGEKYFTNFSGYMLYNDLNRNNIILSDTPDVIKTNDDIDTTPINNVSVNSSTASNKGGNETTITTTSTINNTTSNDPDDNATLIDLNGHEVYVTKDYSGKYAYAITDSSGERYFTNFDGYLVKGDLGLDKVMLSNILVDKINASSSSNDDNGSSTDSSYSTIGTIDNVNNTVKDFDYEVPTINYSATFSSLLNSGGFLDLTKFDDSDAREINKSVLDNSSRALNSGINTFSSYYSDTIRLLGSDIVVSNYAGVSIKDLEAVFSSSLDNYSDKLNQQLSQATDCLQKWADNKIELKANAEKFNILTTEKNDLLNQLGAHKAKMPRLSDSKYTRTETKHNSETGEDETYTYQDAAAYGEDYAVWEGILKELETKLNDVMKKLALLVEQIEAGLQKNIDYENKTNQCSEAISKLAVLSDESTFSDIDTISNKKFKDKDFKNKSLKNFYNYEQDDEKWGLYPLSSGNYKEYGCGPTCLAMVLRYYTGDSSITPLEIGEYAKTLYMAVGDNGTHADVYFAKTAANYGINCRQVSHVTGVDMLCKELNNGNILIMGNGGHFITLVGITNDDKIVVSDPNGKDGAYTKEEFYKKYRVGWQVFAFNNNENKSV